MSAKNPPAAITLDFDPKPAEKMLEDTIALLELNRARVSDALLGELRLMIEQKDFFAPYEVRDNRLELQPSDRLRGIYAKIVALDA